MSLPTVRTARGGSDPLAWGVLVALAAIATLLLTHVASAAGISGFTSRPASTLSLAPAGSTTQSGSSQSAGSDSMGGSSSSSSSSPKKIAVSISGYAFNPASLTINVGDTVTWTNKDKAPHTVSSTSGPEKFDSPSLQKGQSWSFTFTKAGAYAYYCEVHPDMKGSIKVKGSSTSGGGSSGTGSLTPCEPSLASSIADPFWMHFTKGHLEESPGQQASDILNTDQYIKTHTVLIETMGNTAEQEATAHAMDAASTFWMHVQKGHLGESPGQQANDILNPDQYVKTHTVLFGDMLTPYVGIASGSC